ncbi:MAG: transposase [Candidatus Omnitrophica bacterium]|nr:transposase [Candidatus Omnitrophota bacterium]
MARIARIVGEGLPHHIVQRGNRRQDVFFSEDDKKQYLEMLYEQKRKYGLEVWSYCLMDNHVHLIVVPKTKESLSRAIGELHKNYTRMINFREKWRGYLWEGRFKSFILDERYVYSAVRYVERNPVRAGIVRKAAEYKYSSAKIRVGGFRSDILDDFYLVEEIENWSRYLEDEEKEKELKLFRRHGETGRPLGSREFLEQLSYKMGMDIIPKKPGPKPKHK